MNNCNYKEMTTINIIVVMVTKVNNQNYKLMTATNIIDVMIMM